jgi:hypothetical protein
MNIQPIHKINSFDQVKIHRNSLILSDIDETILRFDQVKQEWWRNNFNSHYVIHQDYAGADSYAFGKWIEVINMTKPSHTDHTGFFRLLERIKKTGSDIQFVTARNSDLAPHTQKHFGNLGLNYMDFQVHHLSSMQKGLYIESQIPTDSYDHIIFIDDLDSNINSVQKYLTHPKLTVYKFEMD